MTKPIGDISGPRGARVDDLSQLYDYTVLDTSGKVVGAVSALWTSDTKTRVALVGLSAGTKNGRDRVVPAENFTVDLVNRTVRLTINAEAIEAAPDFVANFDVSPDEYTRLREYYGVVETAVLPSPLQANFPLNASNLMATDGPSGVVAGESAEDVGLPPLTPISSTPVRPRSPLRRVLRSTSRDGVPSHQVA